MSHGAEESLIALLEAMLTLAAQDIGVRMHRPKPTIKAGGHPEEIFVDLSEEEKDELTCNICYQILRETMQCENKHKFCHSCLFVWSTTGQYVNRTLCPVCRAYGYYYRNEEFDERINNKKVLCHLDTCKWNGPLKLLPVHQHTTYGTRQTSRGEDEEVEEEGSRLLELPYLGRAAPRLPHRSQSRFSGTGLTASRMTASLAPPSPVASPTLSNEVGSITSARRRNVNSIHSETVTSAEGLPQEGRDNTSDTVVAAAGTARSPTRLTNRQRMPPVRRRNNNRTVVTDNNNNQAIPTTRTRESVDTASTGRQVIVDAASNTLPRTPRPPSTPRPNPTAHRFLPGITHSNSRVININSRDVTAPPAIQQIRSRSSETESASMSVSTPVAPASQPSGNLGSNLTEIRDRLQESRSRLDSLMTTFSGELERSRNEMADFQIERERQRQEQLTEVRDLGRRLGQVASELRRLLDSRRSLHGYDD